MDNTELKNLSAPEKVRLISDRIKGRLGDAAALHYDSAVALYVSQGIEPMESEVFFQPFWPKTKEILDRWAEERDGERAEERARQFRFMEIVYKEIWEEEVFVEGLAAEADVEVSEMRWLLETYGDIFSKEGYEREVELGHDWGSYSDFVNDALVAASMPDEFDELYELIQLLISEAKRKGEEVTFEEMLDRVCEMKRARGETLV